MYNILNSISFVNLYTELATVIRLAVVFFFFKSGIQMCTTAIIIIIIIIIRIFTQDNPSVHCTVINGVLHIELH